MNIRTAILSLAAVTASVPVFANAASCQETFRNGACIYGEPASGAYDRTVDLSTKQRVDVAYGETVKFVDQGSSFVWTFDGLDQRAVDLAKIAPSGLDTHASTVYVAGKGYDDE